MVNIEDIAVVVRSAGERTKLACSELLKEIFPLENIRIIESVPFSKAITDSWDIAINKQKSWLFCIDADVLISYNEVNKLINKINDVDENVFEIQGLVLDKFFPVYRPAGNHLYRTKYVEKAREFIPAEGLSLRPESDMLNRMSTAGFPWVQCDVIIGLHDYDQYYGDIYRKCFLQAHKHSYILPLVEKHWLKNAKSDTDFKVALWASLAGKLYNEVVYIDKRFLEDEAHKLLAFLKIDEKSRLESNSIFVQNHLDNYLINRDDALQAKIFDKRQWNKISNTARINDSGKALHWKLLNTVGEYIIKVGKKLKSVSR